jgi:CRP-like cAMP-binding protein
MNMSGKIIQVLRTCPLTAALSEAELRLVANCGQIHEYASGQFILEPGGQDERLFILRQGRVALQLKMWSDSGLCDGEAVLKLATPGELFGWAAWVRPDRIGMAAQAVEATSLVAIDLERLGDTEVFTKIGQQLIVNLYARLQEGGVCPPNVEGLLKLKRAMQV